ncbi:DUF1772 domain-containing protein [Paenibacillus sp. PCH8]|nr:DUF1772 domain-containing protein [Paenibacillus sp. PCH8]
MFIQISALLSILTTSIIAGTVFAYANSVMPGLRKGEDQTFVLAVRQLNSSVNNPIFLLVSNGALVAQIVFISLTIYTQDTHQIIWCSLALGAYIATLLITFMGNLPLNKEIIDAEIPQEDKGWEPLRTKFESRWTKLNLLRTITCILSVVFLLFSMPF